MPMEVLDRFPWERHTAHGVKPDAFLHDRVDILDLFVHDTVFPCGITIPVICVQNSLVSCLLDLLTLFRR